MTQPVSPGARAACYEPPAEPIECTSPPPLEPSCAEGLPSFEVARAPPDFEPRITTETAALRFCREADTVIEGFLCSEPVVVSNACRKPNNAFDAQICDEPRMHALQTKVWEASLWIIKTVVSQILGASKGR